MKHRSLLMIPGPIEFDPEVMAALAKPTTSHVAPNFIEMFGRSLECLRQVFACPDGQPFILAGSGTLGMDTAAANLVEPGDRALVLSTGYFGDRMAGILERYGAQVTCLRSAPGGQVSLAEAEAILRQQAHKLVTITQVDTSTGVLAPVKETAELASRYGALMAVDGVCSVAGEELDMRGWGVDLAFTASQKAIGVPPGLALLVAGPRAMEAFRQRRTPVGSYYADWANWLPVMQAYEARKPAYFGTPAVNLVYALEKSLEQILAEGLAARIERHRRLAQACRSGLAALGLGMVPHQPEFAAHTMSAPRYPAGVQAGEFLAAASKAGVILAGGLHPDIRTEYFRIGHMGVANLADILAVLSAVEAGLAACGVSGEPGRGVAAAQAEYLRS